jgi:hypothetical protein
MVGLKKTGCDIGYGFTYTGDEMKVEDINEQMDESDYSDDSGSEDVWERCKEKYGDDDFGEMVADLFCYDDAKAASALSRLGFEDFKEGGTVAWDEGCPNSCRWITTDRKMGAGCGQFCNEAQAVPEGDLDDLLDDTRAAVEDGDMDEAISLAQQSCYMIIPAEALTDPDCTGCSYLLDPGFASYPPVHQRCDNLCGKNKMVGISKDSGRSQAIDGFDGPAQTKAITKLVVPALILPLLNLVITFMFIRTLSPILGGDVDIP